MLPVSAVRGLRIGQSRVQYKYLLQKHLKRMKKDGIYCETVFFYAQ